MTTEVQTSSSPPAEKASRWWFVHLSIVAAFVLFFLFMAILYWYWLQTPEPTSIIRVQPGNAQLDGTRVRIEGQSLQRPIEVVLSEENDYGTRIYLVPGNYLLRIERPDGSVIVNEHFAMGPYYERTVRIPGGSDNQ